MPNNNSLSPNTSFSNKTSITILLKSLGITSTRPFIIIPYESGIDPALYIISPARYVLKTQC